MCRQGCGCLSRLGAEDEPCLVLLFQAGHVLHYAFTVGDGQLVGAIGHQVELTSDEDYGEREHGHYDEGKTHGQCPGRVALEALLGLETGGGICVLKT